MFRDRQEAGRKLAEKIFSMHIKSPAVFGIPRGGVIVAEEVSKKLKAPLDIVVTRKLGSPFNPELGFGAIGARDVLVLNEDIVEQLSLTEEEIEKVREEEQDELERRTKEYGGKKINDLRGKTAILVDDGIATGYTVLAAILFLKALKPGKVVVAAPVCAQDSAFMIERSGVDVVCLDRPYDFQAVGQFYQDFPQITDQEVKSLLKR